MSTMFASERPARVRDAALRAVVLVSVLVASACGGSSRPAPTAPAPTSPSPSGPPADDSSFRVAVLLSGSRLPAPDEVQRVFARANDTLLQKTGERMSQVDLVASVSGALSPFSQAVAYVSARATAPPDGVLAFADDPT